MTRSIAERFQTDIKQTLTEFSAIIKPLFCNWCNQMREKEWSAKEACLLTSTLYELSLDASVKGFDPK